MDEELKDGLKKMAKDAELRLAKSILRWKYKKDGKEMPGDQDMESRSKQVTDQANEILSRRGKRIWNELKKAYQEGREKGR